MEMRTCERVWRVGVMGLDKRFEGRVGGGFVSGGHDVGLRGVSRLVVDGGRLEGVRWLYR